MATSFHSPIVTRWRTQNLHTVFREWSIPISLTFFVNSPILLKRRLWGQISWYLILLKRRLSICLRLVPPSSSVIHIWSHMSSGLKTSWSYEASSSPWSILKLRFDCRLVLSNGKDPCVGLCVALCLIHLRWQRSVCGWFILGDLETKIQSSMTRELYRLLHNDQLLGVSS